MFYFQALLFVLFGHLILLITGQSLISLSSHGMIFYPIDEETIFLIEINAENIINCAQNCDMYSICRTFNYDYETKSCRLYEGDIENTGRITSSNSTRSVVGSLQLTSRNFIGYGLPCSSCVNSRNLVCRNSICQCQSHTYFDGSICQSQKFTGIGCLNTTECRKDLNLTCQFDSICQREETVVTYGPPSFWSFDNNTLDSYGYLPGVPKNSPGYVSPGVTGNGFALNMNSTNNQYVQCSYKNLTYASVTVEMWIYPRSLSSGDNGLFFQQDSGGNRLQFHCVIRNYRLYMGFYGNDTKGTTILKTDNWYHAAFVYDYALMKQIIYLNGFEDGRSTVIFSYLGSKGNTLIGLEISAGPTYWYFDRLIDQVSLVMRAKSANEILDDATLTTYHTMNIPFYKDAGPLNLSGSLNTLTIGSGKIYNSLQFRTSTSYYQVKGFVLLGITNQSFSISLWIQPIFTNGTTLIHYSTNTNGLGWCFDFLGFSSSGNLIVSLIKQQIIGPVINTNVWTHIATTYSTVRGLRLYVNGIFINSTSTISYIAPGQPVILTLGNPLDALNQNQCNSSSMIMGIYKGSLDEFRVYSRELNSTDVFKLANA